MRHALFLASLLALTTIAPSCGGADALSPSAVQNVPPGNATGSALSGSWDIRRVTTSCSGVCAATVSGFRVSVCDVGTTDDGSATLTQTDGRLDLDVSDTPSTYRGGVDADGSFELGGYATQDGGSLVITARVDGTFRQPTALTGATLTATASSRTRGTYSGQTLNCTGAYDVTGTAL
jgi:hypothetical protein